MRQKQSTGTIVSSSIIFFLVCERTDDDSGEVVNHDASERIPHQASIIMQSGTHLYHYQP